mgnify:CR=1 FL=1
MSGERSNKDILKELQVIPGIGPSIAQDLIDIGIRSIKDLNGKDPKRLYERSCSHQGVLIDRCLLYVYRCAVYYASHTKYDPELLKWWNWKDPSTLRKAQGEWPSYALRQATSFGGQAGGKKKTKR